MRRTASETIGPYAVWSAIALLAVGALWLHAHLAVELNFDGENSRTEAETLYALRAARTGQPLYHDFARPPHILTQYPPAFYLVPATIARAVGVSRAFVVGRCYTYGAWLGVAGLLFLLVRQEGGSRAGATLAAALWLASGLAPQWANSYRPDAPALLFSLAAIGAYRRQWLPLAVGVLVAAALHKHSAVVALAVIVIEECRQRRFGRAGLVAGAWGVVLGAALGAAQVWSGGVFFKNVFGSLARYHLAAAPWYVALALARGAPAFVGAMFNRGSQLWRTYFWLAFLLALVTVVKAGANVNYFLEPFAAACVLTGVWACRSGGRKQAAWLGLVAASVAVLVRQDWTKPPATAWDKVLPVVQSLPEPWLIEDSYLAYRLDRPPFILNVGNFGAMDGCGGFDERVWLRRLEAREFVAVITTEPIAVDRIERPLPARWRELIRQRYQLAATPAPNVFVYQHAN
jgi:hypothetical protein